MWLFGDAIIKSHSKLQNWNKEKITLNFVILNFPAASIESYLTGRQSILSMVLINVPYAHKQGCHIGIDGKSAIILYLISSIPLTLRT